MLFQGEPDELVGNTTKGIRQVEEGEMECPSLKPGILDHFTHDGIVFEATRDPGKERFLHCRIYDVVVQDKVSDSSGKDEMVGLAKHWTECNHPEVGGILFWPFLVDEGDVTPTPRRRWGSKLQNLGEERGHDVVC